MSPNIPFNCTLLLCLPLSSDTWKHTLWVLPHWVVLEGEMKEKSIILNLSFNTWYFSITNFFLALAFIFFNIALKTIICLEHCVFDISLNALGEGLRQNSVMFRIFYIGLRSPVICCMHFDNVKIYSMCWSVNLF